MKKTILLILCLMITIPCFAELTEKEKQYFKQCEIWIDNFYYNPQEIISMLSKAGVALEDVEYYIYKDNYIYSDDAGKRQFLVGAFDKFLIKIIDYQISQKQAEISVLNATKTALEQYVKDNEEKE